jgi:uncharacterized cupredoxin-like copper-binding protein
MPIATRRLALVVAGTALLLSAAVSAQHAFAHGDSHGHGHVQAFAAGEPGDPKAPARVAEIVMGEGSGTMSYTPDRIEVRKGEHIRLVLRNAGELRHELVIDTPANNAKHKAEMEKNPHMSHDEGGNARTIDPKQSAEIVWRFTKAGTFEFACLIPGHYEAGMKGVVVVR